MNINVVMVTWRPINEMNVLDLRKAYADTTQHSTYTQSSKYPAENATCNPYPHTWLG